MYLLARMRAFMCECAAMNGMIFKHSVLTDKKNSGFMGVRVTLSLTKKIPLTIFASMSFDASNSDPVANTEQNWNQIKIDWIWRRKEKKITNGHSTILGWFFALASNNCRTRSVRIHRSHWTINNLCWYYFRIQRGKNSKEAAGKAQCMQWQPVQWALNSRQKQKLT